MNSNQTWLRLRDTDISLAYCLLRIVVGINYFNHGFTRIGNIPGFMDSMVGAMEGAWMPEPLVRLTAFFVSPVEMIFGLFLILGLFTRVSLIMLFGLMAILMYGVTVVQNWDSASSQLIYNIVLFILLAGVGYNRFALDNKLFGQRDRTSVTSTADAKIPTNISRQGRGRDDRSDRQRKYRLSFWTRG